MFKSVAFLFNIRIYLRKIQPFVINRIIYIFFDLQEVPDENYDLPYHQSETNGDAVMIKMDVPGREEPSFPKEKWKTFIGE